MKRVIKEGKGKYWAVTRVLLVNPDLIRGELRADTAVIAVCNSLSLAEAIMQDEIDRLCNGDYGTEWNYTGHRYNAHFVQDDLGRVMQLSIEGTPYFEETYVL